MPDLYSSLGFLSLVMIFNGLLTLPFGILASRAFRTRGKLSPFLAAWSGVAMHGHALMTFAAAWVDRGSLYPANPLSIVLGAGLIIAGAYVIYLGRKAYGDQSRVYGLKEDALITNGIYQRSRNPQYFGYGVMFVGAALGLGSGISLIFVAVFGLMIHAGVTLVEEPHLERVFGESYRDYKSRVSRYFF